MVHWECHIPSYQTPTRLLSDPIRFNEAPSFFSDSSMQFNSKRCQPASYQLPIRFLSEKILILQRNFDSKPAHHQGCSANFNFRAKTATFITGGLWCTGNVTFLPIRLLPDPYQILSDSMRHLPFWDSSMQFKSKRCQPASYQLPIRFPSEKILILQRNLDSKPAHHQGCSAIF